MCSQSQIKNKRYHWKTTNDFNRRPASTCSFFECRIKLLIFRKTKTRLDEPNSSAAVPDKIQRYYKVKYTNFNIQWPELFSWKPSAFELDSAQRYCHSPWLKYIWTFSQRFFLFKTIYTKLIFTMRENMNENFVDEQMVHL